MKISSLVVPKYRDLHDPGDDTVLILPGLLAVFDGASSPALSRSGESSGRAASAAAARAVAGMAIDGSFAEVPAPEICARIQHAIAGLRGDFTGIAHPATTMAAVALGHQQLRLVVIGDSGVRINGRDTYRCLKPIDEIWTMGRVLVFRTLAERHHDLEMVETLSRRCAFHGLGTAQAESILTAAEAARILSETLAVHGGEGVADFLRDGIVSQYKFANNRANRFGYSVLNGDPTLMTDVIDVTLDRSTIRSIEIFSDGYFSLPEGTSVADWEAEFARIEALDPHKIDLCPSPKGSTRSQFSDDRSVICAELG